MKKFELLVKNFLLRILLFLIREPITQDKISFSKDSKILFVRLNKIGDALVSTPLLHLIKKNIGCEVFVLADSKNHFVYNNNNDVNFVKKYVKGFSNFFDTIRWINSQKFDAIVDLHTDVSTTVSFIIALSKVPNKFALEKENKILFTKTVKMLDINKFHVVDRLLEIMKLFNINLDKNSANIIYNPSKQSYHFVEEYLKRKFKSRKFIIGVNISSGDEARYWGVDKYRKLLTFLENYNVEVILLCTTRDLRSALQITSAKEKIFYTPVFDEFAAFISKIDLLISPDTATIHLASAFCKPVFGIYVNYDTEELIWSPYKSEFDCVITKEPTLANVTADEVLNKLTTFLGRYTYEQNKYTFV
jgi:ADP-heptose:LPS heptosyltransferase